MDSEHSFSVSILIADPFDLEAEHLFRRFILCHLCDCRLVRSGDQGLHAGGDGELHISDQSDYTSDIFQDELFGVPRVIDPEAVEEVDKEKEGADHFERESIRATI